MRFGLRCKVGYLVAGLLLFFIVTDVTLRFIQGTLGVFSAYTEIRRSTTRGEAFEPNSRWEMPVTYGDLARFANVEDSKERRSLRFSTDALGFRNAEASGPVAGILFGDSFAMAGDDDRDTLSAQLGQRIGCTVYNAASPDAEFRRPDLSLVRSLAKRIGLANGFVMIEQVERRALVARTPREPRKRNKFLTSLSNSWRSFMSLTRESPVKRFAENTLRSIRDDRILPNSYQENVVRGILRNGDPMLFLPNELKTDEITHLPPLDYWIKLNRDLDTLRLKLLVVLVPNKYTVYRHLLEGRQQTPAADQDLLSQFARALQAAGVSVINLTPVLKRHAETGLPRHQYVYWRNDTHWNDEGVRIAVDEIVRKFPQLTDACH